VGFEKLKFVRAYVVVGAVAAFGVIVVVVDLIVVVVAVLDLVVFAFN